MKSEYMVKAWSILLKKNTAVPMFLSMTDEEAGQLMKGICYFWSGDDVSFENPRMQTIFTALATTLEGKSKEFLVKVGKLDDVRGNGNGNQEGPDGSLRGSVGADTEIHS